MTMRKWIGTAITVCVVTMAASTVRAQAPEDFTDSYRRFKPIPEDKLTPAEKAYIPTRTGMPPGVYPTDPFEVIMLRTPGVPEILSAWLKQFRDNATLSPKAQELSILFSGRKWNSQAIWWGHQKEARQAGASSAVMDSIEQGKRLPGMAPDELALYNYLDELYTKHAVSDATFKKAVEQFGEPGVLNIIGICGFYDYLSMFINTSKIYIPEQFKAMAPKYPQATAH